MSDCSGPAPSFARWIGRLGLALALAAPLCLGGPGGVPPAAAQDPSGASAAPRVDSTGALVPNTGGRGPIGTGGAQPGSSRSASSGPNYDEWTAMAGRADALLADARAGGDDLDRMRALLVDWREALLGAQSANSTRIAVIRSQIAALGPAPAEGTTEAPEIARRRAELNDQLVRLQAPGIKADEAYEQADGLILQIDRLRRDRQAEELLRLWPSPVNPANWPAALAGVSATTVTLWEEAGTKFRDPAARKTLVNNLPLILLLLAFSFAVLWRGRRWLDQIVLSLPLPSDARAARVSLFLAELGQVIVPVAACVALTVALRSTGLLGPLGFVLSGVISFAGVTIFTAIWLGGQIFSDNSPLRDVAEMSPERRVQGRFLLFACGLLIALGRVRSLIVSHMDLDESFASVTLFPVLLFGGLVLIRIGRLLTQMARMPDESDEATSTLRNVMRLVGKAALGIGVIGPVLAAIGYNSAAAAIIQPAVVSLALLGILLLVQQIVFDLWALVMGQQANESNALLPVLFGFALALASLPVFALIWGADTADLTELWARFQGGFTLGETRISPTDFLLFVVIFVIGYSATRMLQGVLKGQILPRIGMDQGGRNAIAVGTGYVGIFLSALIAINATGIDLSGLAIVAGALSVGIGFGLQAIVSNFVSGIILLIERPVSEGDWIEVGTVQGIVKSISVRSTRIQTFDRSDIIVPNQDLITGRVTNWTRFNQSGRIVVPVTVPYTADSQLVARILSEIGAAQPMVLRQPAPQVVLMGFKDEMMTFELRVILRDIHNFVQARSDINHEILRRFRDEGIPFSAAHRDHLAKQAEDQNDARDLANREAEVAMWLAGDDADGTAAPIVAIGPDAPDRSVVAALSADAAKTRKRKAAKGPETDAN